MATVVFPSLPTRRLSFRFAHRFLFIAATDDAHLLDRSNLRACSSGLVSCG